MMDQMMGHMGAGVLWMLLAGVILVGLVLWVIRVLFPDFASEDHKLPTDRSTTVLRERFAKGEIDRDEFEERRSVLQDGRHA